MMGLVRLQVGKAGRVGNFGKVSEAAVLPKDYMVSKYQRAE